MDLVPSHNQEIRMPNINLAKKKNDPYVGTHSPLNPFKGDVWFSTVKGEFYIWDGVQWQKQVVTKTGDLTPATTVKRKGSRLSIGHDTGAGLPPVSEEKEKEKKKPSSDDDYDRAMSIL